MRQTAHHVLVPLLLALGLVPVVAAAFPVNDTGQVICYDGSATPTGTVTAGTPDPEASGFDGQDCTGGAAAVDAIGQQAKLGGSSVAGRDYSKIANNGSVLPNSATRGSGPTDWGCTRDNLTGLVWELRPDDGSLRDQDSRFYWGSAPAPAMASNRCNGSSVDQCVTDFYVTTTNTQQVCGFSDWRLPTPYELESLLAQDEPGSSKNQIDRVWFPDQRNDEIDPFYFWTASTSPDDANSAWVVDFDFGWVGLVAKADPMNVRLVRGQAPLDAPGTLTVSEPVAGQFVVTDDRTGLMWSQCVEGVSGASCTYDAQVHTVGYTWQQALGRATASTHAGFSDWRLPTVAELSSLRDYTSIQALSELLPAPSILGGKIHWSSTSSPRPTSTTTALTYNYDAFSAYSDTFKTSPALVRLVRAGNHLNTARSTDADFAPDAFTLNDVPAAAGSLIQSNIITVAGLTSATALFVSGAADSQYAVNGGNYTARAGAVRNGDTVRVRHTASATEGGTTSTTLNIGGVSESFVTTSQAPIVATKLLFSAQPSTGVVNVAFANPTVRITDANNTTAPDASNTVTLAKATGPGALTCNALSVAAVGGVANFSGCKVDQPGSYTLTATATGLTGATTNTFVVTAGPKSQLTFSTPPAGAAAGAPFTTQPKVAIVDANGFRTADTDTITLAASSGPGSLTCTATAVAAVAGEATFAGCRLDQPGTYTLTATATGLTSASVSNFTVTAGTKSKLRFSAQPSGTLVNAALTMQPRVEILDTSGLRTADTDTITLTKESGPGNLSCTATAVAAAAGEATFAACRVDKPGTYRLSATATGLTNAISAEFTVTAGPKARLAFTQVPTAVTAGVVFATAPKVVIEDAAGNQTIATDTITLSKATGPGTLRCTTPQVSATRGEATFADCVVDQPGSYTLSATAAGLTSAASSTFVAQSSGTATKLLFQSAPTTAVVGEDLAVPLVVVLADAANNPVAGTNTITVNSSTIGSLKGISTLAAVDGVASFPGLRLATLGTQTITASSPGLTAATTAPISVTKGSQVIRSNEVPQRVLLDASPLTITAIGGNSGRPVTFSAAPAATCEITTSGTLTLLATGTCTITANQTGDAFYDPAAPVSTSIAVIEGGGLPGPVTGLTVTPYVQSLRINFTPPDDDSDDEIAGYGYRFKEAGADGATITGTCEATCTVTNLAPNGDTSYTDFAVWANNQSGKGPEALFAGPVVVPASSGVATTLTPTAPANPRFDFFASRSMGLSWDPSLSTDSGGLVYLVQVAPDDGTSVFVDVGLTADTFIAVVGLDRLTRYRFRVAAVLSDGTQGPFSTEIVGTTEGGTTPTLKFVTTAQRSFPEGFTGPTGIEVDLDNDGGRPLTTILVRWTRNEAARKYFVSANVAQEYLMSSAHSRRAGTGSVRFRGLNELGRGAPIWTAVTITPVNDASQMLGSSPVRDATNGKAGSVNRQIAGFASGFRAGPPDETDDEQQSLVGYFVEPDPANVAPSPISAVSIDANGTLHFTVDQAVAGNNAYRYGFYAMARDSGADRYGDGLCVRTRTYGPYEQRACSPAQKFVIALNGASGVALSAIPDNSAEFDEGSSVAAAAKAAPTGRKGNSPFALEDPDTDGEYLNNPGAPAPRDYRLEVSNFGTQPLTGAGLSLPAPSGLSNVRWTCVAPVGACTPASGSGAIDVRFDLGASSGVDRAVILLTGTPTRDARWVQLYPRAFAPTGASVGTAVDAADLVEAVTPDAVFLGGFEGGAR